MPKSRVRQTAVYTPPPKRSSRKQPSAAWVGPTMVTALILGILWLTIGYITQYAFPGMSSMGGQAGNLLLGFGLIIAALGLATQWR